MALQITIPGLLIIYLTALAIAFHRLIFEIELGFIQKLAWFAAVIVCPVIGLLLFYYNLRPSKNVLDHKIESFAARLFKSFLFTVTIFAIMLLVFWTIKIQSHFIYGQ